MALRQFLSNDQFYAVELEAVENALMPQKSVVGSFQASFQPARSLQSFTAKPPTSADVMNRKIAAMSTVDIEALQGLADEGIKFADMDLLTAVTTHKNHPDCKKLVELLCQNGATCADWLRPSVTDHDLLEIIDRHAVKGADTKPLPARL